MLENKRLWALKSCRMLPVSFSRSLLDKCVCVCALITQESRGGGKALVFEPWLGLVVGCNKKHQLMWGHGMGVSCVSLVVCVCPVKKKKSPRFQMKGSDWASRHSFSQDVAGIEVPLLSSDLHTDLHKDSFTGLNFRLFLSHT